MDKANNFVDSLIRPDVDEKLLYHISVYTYKFQQAHTK